MNLIENKILNPKPDVDLLFGDCRKLLGHMVEESVHMALTDPPYFFDGLDSGWNKGKAGKRGTGSVGGLPVGMKFDPRQGRMLQEFMTPIATDLLRILKPGAFALVFSAPRLAHRMAVAFEDSGFELRDMYAWHFTKKAQFKAFSMNHFILKRSDFSENKKRKAVKDLENRKTPQLRPQFESILCLQKPRQGTFVDNWLLHKTGLIDASQTFNGQAPSTVMTVEKEDKAKYNTHLTPKPIEICQHLIRLFTKPGQTVIDPFLGSGTTCVAAKISGRNGIGIEINKNYINIAKQRLKDTL